MLTVRRGMAALLLLLVVGSGCGSDGDDGSATGNTGGATSVAGGAGNRDDKGSGTGKIDACTLLTDQEAGAVLGGTVVGHGPGLGVGESVCEWEMQGDYTVTVSVGTRGTAPRNRFRPDSILTTPEPVPELGQEAGWYVGLNTVEFASDERRNSVQVVSPDASANKRKAIELAVKLKDRIR